MSELNEEALDHVVTLAHLEIDAAEKTAYLDQLGRIVDHMNDLNEISLDGVKPSTGPLEQPTYLREDEVKDYGDLLLEKNAPKWEDSGFVVPKIIDRSES